MNPSSPSGVSPTVVVHRHLLYDTLWALTQRAFPKMEKREPGATRRLVETTIQEVECTAGGTAAASSASETATEADEIERRIAEIDARRARVLAAIAGDVSDDEYNQAIYDFDDRSTGDIGWLVTQLRTARASLGVRHNVSDDADLVRATLATFVGVAEGRMPWPDTPAALRDRAYEALMRISARAARASVDPTPKDGWMDDDIAYVTGSSPVPAEAPNEDTADEHTGPIHSVAELRSQQAALVMNGALAKQDAAWLRISLAVASELLWDATLLDTLTMANETAVGKQTTVVGEARSALGNLRAKGYAIGKLTASDSAARSSTEKTNAP